MKVSDALYTADNIVERLQHIAREIHTLANRCAGSEDLHVHDFGTPVEVLAVMINGALSAFWFDTTPIREDLEEKLPRQELHGSVR